MSNDAYFLFQDFHAFVHPTLKELRKSIKQQNTAKVEVELTAAILKSVVGYLGTIEMPPKDGVTGKIPTRQTSANRGPDLKFVLEAIIIALISKLSSSLVIKLMDHVRYFFLSFPISHQVVLQT